MVTLGRGQLMLVVPILLLGICCSSDAAAFEIRVLHINDLHSRFEPVTLTGSPCDVARKKNKCVGGVARIKRFVDLVRSNDSEHRQVLFLSAGDAFQGTLWYSNFKWRVVANLTNQLGLTAASLGNHEFDDGLDDLNEFVHSIPYDMLACNVQFGNPNLQDNIKPYKVVSVTFKGVQKKIGIIGYVTTDTKRWSKGGFASQFEDELPALRRNVRQLQDKGISIIIALGHSGYEMDKKIAREVDGVSLVVGGHTNTFLWSGPTPASYPPPGGPYPTMVEQKSGNKVLVVHTNGYGRFLGDVTVEFDDGDRVVGWKGRPSLLDSSFPEDQGLAMIVKDYRKELDVVMKRSIGRIKVKLLGDRQGCRLGECPMGSFLTDVMASGLNVSIGLYNSGGIRGSLGGDITTGSIYTVLPFANNVDLIKVRGDTLRKMFEHSVSLYDPMDQDPPGYFLQISGIQVIFDICKPVNQRVISLHVTEPNNHHTAITNDEIYTIAISAYLASGGDGYSMIPNEVVEHQNLGILDKDILIAFIRKNSPISKLPQGGRITVLTSSSRMPSSAMVARPIVLLLVVAAILST